MENRRKWLLTTGGAVLASPLVAFRKAHGLMPDAAADPGGYSAVFLQDHDENEPMPYPHVHEGKGEIAVKFFKFEQGADPALLMTYDIPPGASEGVHTHNVGDTVIGSFDEFYYIVSGNGVMEIDGEQVAVKPGDNVFTPNGVAHGIENTSPDEHLKVYLVAMRRA